MHSLYEVIKWYYILYPGNKVPFTLFRGLDRYFAPFFYLSYRFIADIDNTPFTMERDQRPYAQFGALLNYKGPEFPFRDRKCDGNVNGRFSADGFRLFYTYLYFIMQDFRDTGAVLGPFPIEKGDRAI